jgi:hypothetical protein
MSISEYITMEYYRDTVSYPDATSIYESCGEEIFHECLIVPILITDRYHSLRSYNLLNREAFRVARRYIAP